jgi:hypothetical protein
MNPASTADELAAHLRISKRQLRTLLKQAEAIAGPLGIPVGKRRRIFEDASR